MRNSKGQFIPATSENQLPVGTIRIRTRYQRGGEQRAWIKTEHPNTWMLLARHTWEGAHGPIPRGMSLHHRDGNSLNDDLSNLELLTKAEHLSRHRPEFQARSIAGLVKARQERRWSTRKAGKWTDDDLTRALAACRAGESVLKVEARTGISEMTLRRRLRST